MLIITYNKMLITTLLIIKNRSAKKILNNSGLTIELRVTLNAVLIQVLYVFFQFLFFVFYLTSSHVLDVMLED